MVGEDLVDHPAVDGGQALVRADAPGQHQQRPPQGPAAGPGPGPAVLADRLTERLPAPAREHRPGDHQVAGGVAAARGAEVDDWFHGDVASGNLLVTDGRLSADRPVEYVHSIHRGDRYRIVSRLALGPRDEPPPPPEGHHPGIPPGDFTRGDPIAFSTHRVVHDGP